MDHAGKTTLWKSGCPWLDASHAALPDRIEHRIVHRSAPPFTFLHEVALAHYGGHFYGAWNACGTRESDREAVIQWTRWEGGFDRRDEPRILRPPLRVDATTNWESCQLFVHGDRLYALVGQVHGQPHDPVDNGGRTVVFRLDGRGGQWEEIAAIDGFQPLNPPMALRDGTLLAGGEYNLHEPRVMRSASGDPGQWTVVTLPLADGFRTVFPETALMEVGNGVRAFVRSTGGMLLTSLSGDGGADWSPLVPADIPASSSKMCAGRLSTGEGFLVLNSPEPAGDRHWLQILVTAPGADRFERQVLVRRGESPRCRDGRVSPQWSYPSALEHDGRFYVGYSISKEDFGLSILPVEALRGR